MINQSLAVYVLESVILSLKWKTSVADTAQFVNSFILDKTK